MIILFTIFDRTVSGSRDRRSSTKSLGASNYLLPADGNPTRDLLRGVGRKYDGLNRKTFTSLHGSSVAGQNVVNHNEGYQQVSHSDWNYQSLKKKELSRKMMTLGYDRDSRSDSQR